MESHEEHRRSGLKSLSYRLFSISVDSFVAYFFTHDVALSAGIVLFVNGYSTVLYYIHERVWAHIHWGRKPVVIPNAIQKTTPVQIEIPSIDNVV